MINGLDVDPFVCAILGGCTSDAEFHFGEPNDLPVVGDWDGDGTDVIGVFRGDNIWLLDANGNGRWDGTAGGDLRYEFGASGDIPVVGDWDGDGRDEIGVYRDDTSWLLDVNGNGSWDGELGGDVLISFGSVDDCRSSGTGTVTGTDDFGTHRADTRWFLDANGNRHWDGTAGGDELVQFGAVGDAPVIGDWYGDESDDIGVFRDGTWKVDANGNRTWDGTAGGDLQIEFGDPVDTAIVGDWNGDGTDDVGVYMEGRWRLDTNGNHRWDLAARARTKWPQPEFMADPIQPPMVVPMPGGRPLSGLRSADDRPNQPSDEAVRRMALRDWQVGVEGAFEDSADWLGDRRVG